MNSYVTRRAKLGLLVGAIFHASLVLEHLPAWLILVCMVFFLAEFAAPEFTARWIRRELKSVLLVAGGLGLTLSYAPHFGIEPVLSILVFVLALSLLGATRPWMGRVNVFLMSAITVFVVILTDEFWVSLAILANVLFLTILFFELNAPDKGNSSLVKYLRSAVILTIPIGIVVVALFTFLPRFYRGWFTRNNVSVMGYGATSILNPGDVSRLVRSHRKAFRVQFLDARPMQSSELYWRGEVFDQSEGMRWKKGRERVLTTSPLVREKTHAILHDVYLEPRFDTALFALDAPLQLNIESTSDFEVAQTTGRVFELGGSARRILFYHALSAEGVQEEQLSAEDRKKFTRIDESYRTPKIALLLQRLALNAQDPDGAAVKLGRFFSSGHFKYSLEPGALKEKALEGFLIEERAGFCEHYSAAAASVLRLAGIPSRLITGFQGGDINRFDSLYTVRDSHAHAWIEYWSDKRLAWVRFDPTQYVAPERLVSGPQVVSGSQVGLFEGGLFDEGLQALDAISVRWNGWMVSSGSAWPKNEWNQVFKDWNEELMWVAAGIALLVAAFILFRKAKIARGTASGYEKSLIETYEKFCEMCRKRGVVREAWEGPSTFLRKCEKEFPKPLIRFYNFLNCTWH